MLKKISIYSKYIMAFMIWVNITVSKADSLTLPMPNGLKMEFVPVCVKSDDSLFAWKKIKLGDPSGGFKEYPTSMALGGSFPIEKNGMKSWCYYMGKYEVSEQQYAALMTLKKPIKNIHKVFPITNISWFDAMEFSHKYNEWLFVNAKDVMPKYGASYGFVRLPTESEWEFAARGGIEVSADVFDRKTPYPSGKLYIYEWYGGSKSSHNKLKQVGKLKPNPLGLHDMIGNADEMTISLFSVEYYQGKVGGFVIKGNTYITDEKKLRSSYRAEQPFYKMNKDEMKPHTKETLGFRLVLSSIVFGDNKIQAEMASEWEIYRNKLGANTPAALSTSATSTQVAVGGENAFEYLERLKKKLLDKGLMDDEIESSLGYLDSSIRDISTIRMKAEEDAAYLWVKVGSEQVRFVRSETKKLPLVDTLIATQKRQKNLEKLALYKNRKKEHMTNIENALTSYSASVRQMNTLSSQAMEKGFKRYLDFLLSRNDGNQVQVLNRVRKHYDIYQKNKRVDIEQWKQDILF